MSALLLPVLAISLAGCNQHLSLLGNLGQSNSSSSSISRTQSGGHFQIGRGFHLDGSRNSTLGLYRQGTYFYFGIETTSVIAKAFGNAGFVPLAGDYDGDGQTDLAVFDPSHSTFYWQASSTGVVTTVTAGNPGDTPIVADFDGDGKTDIAIYDSVNSVYWYTESSNGVLQHISIGNPGDIPVVGDFDGDGKAEGAIYQVAQQRFCFSLTSTGVYQCVGLGGAGATPLVGDFDGDGIDDLAVYQSSTSTFTFRQSSNGQIVTVPFGEHGDIPIIGDYDGDGVTDIAVFRPGIGTSNQFWYIASHNNQVVGPILAGNPGDAPLGNGRYQPSAIIPTLSYSLLSAAPQTIYQSGVPHVNSNGVTQTQYNSSSFLPRCVYGSVAGTLSQLKSAGFNCARPWIQTLQNVLTEANASSMQVIWPSPQISDVTNIQNNAPDLYSNILGWDMTEEPSSCIGSPSTCAGLFSAYTSSLNAIRAVDSTHPAFALDLSYSYLFPFWGQAGLAQWNQWNSLGQLGLNDDYPFTGASAVSPLVSLSTAADNTTHLVALNNAQKPTWMTIQSFEQNVGTAQFSMPTPAQLRAQVFMHLVHGVTGFIYFDVDSWASRNGQVIGISPSPPASYSNANPGDAIATPTQIAESIALWNGAVSLNAELERLQNVILSPTAQLNYQVAISGTGLTQTPLRSMLKIGAGGVYTLLVINIDNVPLNAQFTLPTVPNDLYSIQSNGARISVGPFANTFTDTIEGFGVRVYEFK